MSDLKNKLDRLNALKKRVAAFEPSNNAQAEKIEQARKDLLLLDSIATYQCTNPELMLQDVTGWNDLDSLDETTDWCEIPAFKQGA